MDATLPVESLAPAPAVSPAGPVPAPDETEAKAAARSRSRLWKVLALGGPVGFIGALPYFLPLLDSMRTTGAATGKAMPPLAVMVLAQLAQVSVITALAAWAGARLMRRSGFDAPYLHALVDGRPSGRRFAAEIPRALLVGALFSAAILALDHFAGAHLPPALRAAPAPAQVDRAATFLRGASSAFYGGIVEELLLRWGVLSALAALFGVMGAKERARFWLANLLSALFFGAGHLPAAHALGVPLTAAVVGFIVTANALAGVACGWLFRKRGLESAMVAHGFGDVCLHALPIFFA